MNPGNDGDVRSDIGADSRELSVRLRDLAGRVASLARDPGPDAVELLIRATALQRAAFVLDEVAVAAVVDLRDGGQG